MKVAFKGRDGDFYTIDSKEIFYVKAAGAYAVIHFASREILVSKSIGEVHKRINDLCRTHKSFLVNLEKIKSFNLKSDRIMMTNGDVVNLSQKRKTDFLKNFAFV